MEVAAASAVNHKTCKMCKTPYAGTEERSRVGYKICVVCDAAPGRDCPGCGTYRPRDEWSDHAWRREGVARCKPCTTQKYRDFRLQRRYGIDQREYDRLLQQQGGRCALCREGPERSTHGHLAVDHDHLTGAVRGLLCSGCNTALGRFGDAEAGLLRALAYVRGEKI